MLKVLDAYSLKARFFPALLSILPALAALAILISWSKFGLTNFIATAGIPVLVYAAADVARRLGTRIQNQIWAEHGKPSMMMLRYSNNTFDTAAKAQYRTFLASKINQPIPTQAEEAANVTAGDAFYERAGGWLRENTRNTKKFAVLFNENVTYGFRRNLLGLKWPALGLNLALVLLCAFILYQKGAINTDDDMTIRLLIVLAFAIIHTVYMAFAVSLQGVTDAGRIYARQLILSCETLMSKVKPEPAPKPTKAKKEK